MHRTALDGVSAIEEGLFGFANVKLGADAKERGIVVRNVHGFRRAVFMGIGLLVVALGCVWFYGRRARHARTELAASGLHQKATECRATVEGILLKQDEIDELCRRLRQREVLDNFLNVEHGYEKELQTRISTLVRSGPEDEARQAELEKALSSQLKWFKDIVGDSVDRMIGPLDAAFKNIPQSIRDLQSEVKAALPAFDEPTTAVRVCADLPAAIAGAPWEQAFVTKMQNLVSVARNATHADLDQKMMAEWSKAGAKLETGKVQPVPASLVAMLLKWYSTATPADLTSVIVANEPLPPPEQSDDEDGGSQDGEDREREEEDGPDDDDGGRDDDG